MWGNAASCPDVHACVCASLGGIVSLGQLLSHRESRSSSHITCSSAPWEYNPRPASWAQAPAPSVTSGPEDHVRGPRWEA